MTKITTSFGDVSFDGKKTWDDIILQKDIKINLMEVVNSFFSNKNNYDKNNVKWKKSVLLYGNVGCGKSSIIKTIASNYNFANIVSIIPGSKEEFIFKSFNEISSDKPTLIYFDFDVIVNSVNISLLINLMDGLSIKPGTFVIGTTTEIDQLQSMLKESMFRFDRRFEISLPDHNLIFQHLRKILPKSINDDNLKQLSLVFEKNNLSFSSLNDVYLTALKYSQSKTITTENLLSAVKEIFVVANKQNNTGKTIDLDNYKNKKSKSKSKIKKHLI